MAKIERQTDKLNVALGCVEAAHSIMRTLVTNGVPTKDQLLAAIVEAESHAKDARGCLRPIRHAAESI